MQGNFFNESDLLGKVPNTETMSCIEKLFV